MGGGDPIIGGGDSIIVNTTTRPILTGQACRSVTPPLAPFDNPVFDLSRFNVLSPDQRIVLENPTSDGVVSLFAPPTPGPTSVEPVPDLMTTPIADFEAWAQRDLERHMTAQRDQILLNFRPCQMYSLRDEYHLLPEIFRDAMYDFQRDPDVYFYVDFNIMDDGQAIPQVHFTRRTQEELGHADSPFVLNIGNPDRDNGGFDLTDALGGVAVAGVVAPRGPRSEVIALRRGGGGPTPEPRAVSGLSIPITIGTAVLMYAFVDWSVSNAPQELQGPIVVADSVLFGVGYQALFETSELMVRQGWLQSGFMGRPNWRALGGSMPHLFAFQYGSAYAFDALGLPIGSTENGIASFATSGGAVLYLNHAGNASRLALETPELAARFSPTLLRMGTAFNSSLGVGMSTGTLAPGLAGGGGALGGGFQALGAFGAVALGSWLGGAAVDFWAYASGASDDPDYVVTRLAWDQINSEVCDSLADDLPVLGHIAGFLGNLFSPVVKGIQSAAISDEVMEGIEYRIGQWQDSANQFAELFNRDLLLIAENSIGTDEQGNLTFNWETFERNLTRYYSDQSRNINNAYGLIRFLAPSSFGSRISDARRIGEMISMNGSVRDRAALERHIRTLLGEAEGGGTRRAPAANSMTNNLRRTLAAERRALRDRTVELGLDVPVPADRLNSAQRQFLYGELVPRRQRIELLQSQLARMESVTPAGWIPRAFGQPVPSGTPCTTCHTAPELNN